MKKDIEKVLEKWNIKSQIQQIYDSAWSIGNDYVIKTTHDLGNLKRNITIMKILDESGIPVAHPIATVDGEDYVEYNGNYYLVMNKLSGTHILNIYQIDYLNIAYDTGKIVANLHKAFISCEQKITFWNNNLLNEMSGWIYDTLKVNNYRYISKSDFQTTLKELKGCYNKLQMQLIHRDIHYRNILFDNNEFSGYIDFDLSQKNVRIFDICYFLMGILIDHEKSKIHIEKWYNIVSKFIEGYESTNPLTKLEKDSICCLMSSIELLFVSYFISNDDEVLAEGAANLYYFVNNNKQRIQSAVHTYFNGCN